MKTTTLAAETRDTHGTSYLLGSENGNVRKTVILSPFFQLKRRPQMIENLNGRTGHLSWSRDIRISEIMTKAFIVGYDAGGPDMQITVYYADSTNTYTGSYGVTVHPSATDTGATIQALVDTAVAAYWVPNGIAVPDSTEWITSVVPRSENSLSLSVQTSTGAVGTQVSASHDALVTVDLSTVTTASIAGNAALDLVLEVAPTNSATAGDWIIKGRSGNAQTLSLAITLQSIQTLKGQVTAYVPKGYFVKVRSTGASGTVSSSVVEARATLL